jgi:chromate reductase
MAGAVAPQVAAADAVLFAAPEYNYSLSAPLKNALDWASRPAPGATTGAWDGKPAAVMGAGGGQGASRAQYHLRQVGVYVNLLLLNKPEVQIQAFAPGTCDLATGELVDPKARERVAALVAALVAWTHRLAPR